MRTKFGDSSFIAVLRGHGQRRYIFYLLSQKSRSVFNDNFGKCRPVIIIFSRSLCKLLSVGIGIVAVSREEFSRIVIGLYPLVAALLQIVFIR